MPTSNGDGLYATDPWRQAAIGQQLPEPAGQPAAFLPQVDGHWSGGRSGATTPFGIPGSHNSAAAPSQTSLHERIQAMRMDPQYQMLAAHPPTFAGHPAPQFPATRQPSEQEAESLRAQQHFLRRQRAEAIAMMEREGIDLPNADWTPGWDFVPSIYASPDHPDRQLFVPAIMAHPRYSQMPNAGQPAAPMDSAMFPDHYAALNNVPRVGGLPTNTYVRDMTDEFFRAQETRGAPLVAGGQGQVPHYGYLPPPTDQDTLHFGPAQHVPIPIPEALAQMRPEIMAIHESQQANLQQHASRQRRNQARNARTMESMRGNLPQPSVPPPVEDPPPPSPYRPGESSLDRQRRTRPQAPIITIFDGDFRQCAICLEPFRYDDMLWRLQCGHTFHKDCWDRAAHTHVERQNGGDANEAPCAVCRGTGTIVAEFRWVLAGQPAEMDTHSLLREAQAMRSADEIRDLREELMRATAQIQALANSAGQPAAPAPPPVAIAEGSGENLPSIRGRLDGRDRLSGANYAGLYEQMPTAPLVTEHEAGVDMLSRDVAGQPANDAWLRRFETSHSRGNQMPYGRSRAPTRGNSQRARGSETPNSVLSARSVSSGVHSDRDLLHQVYMINDDDHQYGTPREGTVLNIALTRSNPANTLEYPSDGILVDHPMTQEEHEAYASSWSSLRKQEWILEQRRRRNERCV